MKIALNVFGILLTATGLIWTLQGANVLPGSFMTGQPFWLGAGIVCMLAGAILLFVVNRGRGARPPEA
jgi:hypothetical protein